MTRNRVVGAAAAGTLLIGLLALAGCTAQGASDSMAWDDPAPMTGDGSWTGGEQVDEFGAPTQADLGDIAAMEGALEGIGRIGAAATLDRQVISTGRVSMSAEDPVAVAAAAVGIVESAGGRVDSRDEQPATDDQSARATLVVRIPSTALTGALDDIGALGEVRQVQLSENDVTTQTRDVAARITALTTSTDRLIDLLAGADDTADLLRIESTLSERQEQLESLQAQQRALTDQVALATVTVSIGSEAQVPQESPDTFLSGLVTGWEALGGFLGGLLVATGVALPWLLVLAILLGTVLIIRRLRRNPAPASTMGE